MIPFVPRKVARRSTIGTQRGTLQPTIPPVTSHETASSPQSVLAEPGDSSRLAESSTSKGKHKHAESPSDEDIWTFLSLSMSEHTMWSDPDLRRTLELSKEGYIPLTYLLSRSTYFSSLYASSAISEAMIAKAIRSQAKERFDIRVLMSSPSRAEWYGKASTSKESVGGYEVRLKGWDEVLKRARNMSRGDWESRTVYMENIPFQHRSIPSICRFTNTLLQSESQNAVQGITLPKHQHDGPGDMPKCKGFALVTLSDPAHIQSLLTQWPWDRLTGSAATSTPNNEEAESEVHREARKIRFRAISKSRWNELNEEYLAYRQSLLEEIQANEEEDYIEDWDEHKTRKRRLGSPLGSEYTEKEKVEGAEGNDRQSGVPVTTLASPYPHNCLLFVRNIHPETNKTTLKTLFAGALMTADGAVQVSGVDYVDFNKGMDSCYLRLAIPAHATMILNHFSATEVVQMNGLDGSGSALTSELAGQCHRPIKVELVEGTREELYWGKVPEKVRKAAVERAVIGAEVGEGDTGGGESKKRKRRK